MSDNPFRNSSYADHAAHSEHILEKEGTHTDYRQEIPLLLTEVTEKLRKYKHPFPLNGSDKRLRYNGDNHYGWYLGFSQRLSKSFFLLYNGVIVSKENYYGIDVEKFEWQDAHEIVLRDLAKGLRQIVSIPDEKFVALPLNKRSRLQR